MAMDQYNDDDDEIMIQYMIYMLNIKNYSRFLLLSVLYLNQGFIGISDTFISSYPCHSYFINI